VHGLLKLSTRHLLSTFFEPMGDDDIRAEEKAHQAVPRNLEAEDPTAFATEVFRVTDLPMIRHVDEPSLELCLVGR
jgi:hypothetical protein